VAGEEGPYIVTIHGGPDGNTDYFLPFFDHLAEDWRVATFNLRGRDGSKMSRKWMEDYSPESDVQDVEAVRRALSTRKMILVGHGFGAVVALKYASVYPQHVSNLVLLNMGVPNHEEWPVARNHIESRLPSPWKEAYAELRAAQHVYTPTAFQQYVRDIGSAASVQNLGNLPVLRERWTTEGDSERAIYRAWGEFDLTSELKKLPMRTLVVASDGDVFPESSVPMVKKLVAGNKRVRFHVLTGASHFPFLERRKSTMGFLEDFLED
jgi:proline iminopeptidase